ncbi:MAG: Hpt domain-containing protein [Lachnospiraceae bacterium]
MNYDKYLPFIDVEEGVNRLMNDMRIYTTVLKKFNGEVLFHDIDTAAKEKDYPNLQLHSHTLKGTAGNLSLKRLQEIALAIESCAKEEKDPGDLITELQEVITATAAAVAELLAGN